MSINRCNPVGWRLQDKATGIEIEAGVTLKDFRGRPATVLSFDAPRHVASEGRINVRVHRGNFEASYYPSVFGAEIVRVEQER